MMRMVAWILSVMLFCMPVLAADEEEEAPAIPDNYADSQATPPKFQTTFPDAPGIVFDVPADMQVTKVNNSVQVESPVHYMFRKMAAQDKQIAAFKKEIEELKKQVTDLEEKARRTEAAALQKITAKSSTLSSFEQPAETTPGT